jgi:Protein of unknown function (DUF3631)
MPAYCAVAIAGLGNLPDTILTRSIVIKMRRRAPDEQIEPYRRRDHAAIGHGLRDRLATWIGSLKGLESTRPQMPAGIADRNADCWEALLAIADAAGGDWPELARVAAVTLVTDAKAANPSLGVRLLADVRQVFGDSDAMPTVNLIAALISIEEAPWGDLKGKPLDTRRLANLLRPYGVSSKLIRISDKVARGYDRTDLHDPWMRYLGSAIEHVTSVTTVSAAASEDSIEVRI